MRSVVLEPFVSRPADKLSAGFVSLRLGRIRIDRVGRCPLGRNVCTLALSTSSPPSSSSISFATASPTRWIVTMERPSASSALSRREAVDYFVGVLSVVLGSEEAAQMSIYDACWETNFGFRCEIEEDSSRKLARIPGVLSVRPDHTNGDAKIAAVTNGLRSSSRSSRDVLPSMAARNNEYWMVTMEKPGVEVVTKAQMVDHFASILTKVLGNEKDAQACMYRISWEKGYYAFWCQLDEESVHELSGVPGVHSVKPDEHAGSPNREEDFKVDRVRPTNANSAPDVKTKRLFVTGLSFYTSEKTLRAAFESFGELVEVKIIMDKISKRSKGYAFIEYTTEDAASAALKEMNGKIINGWMIVVDAAKTTTSSKNYSRGRR